MILIKRLRVDSERRTISSMEICWAILYCSTDIQCNTDIIKAASNLLSFTSNARMNHSLEAGPHNRPTSDLPAMSAQASISSTVDRSLLSPSSPPIQNHQPPNQHQHDQGRTTSVGSPPERSEEKVYCIIVAPLHLANKSLCCGNDRIWTWMIYSINW